MSHCLVNIRIGLYHFQLGRDLRARVSRNDAHIGYRYGFFKVYSFFGIERF